MPETEAAFLVNAYDDPVELIIQGRACFQNARPVSDLFTALIKQGRQEFVVDLQACTAMDSTFLGILAGAGIRLGEAPNPGRLVLTRLSKRNRELVENLGLDHIVEIDTRGAEACEKTESSQALQPGGKGSSKANHDMVLEAHETLSSLSPENAKKFQDVIQFLRSQSEE